MAINKIGVVGGGMMGSEIAVVMAMAGYSVLLYESNLRRREELDAILAALLERGVTRKSWSKEDWARVTENLVIVGSVDLLADRHLIFEAVFEDENVKAELFHSLDANCAPDTIFASNTSSISISVLAASVGPERRRRFLGTHFFSPVTRMELVEVIPAFDTEESIVAAVMDVCRNARKQPIRVKDVVGFAVNRLLHIFWIEAVRLVEEGVASAEDIDKACRLGLGHPVGPFLLMDAVTNSLTLQVQDILHGAYGGRFRPRPVLKQMVRAGFDGRKMGRGWYRYT